MQEHAKAATAAHELAKLAKLDSRGMGCYRAAGLLARCVPLAEQDQGLEERKKSELIESYGSGAVELLRQAVKRGYKNKQLSKVTDFAPLKQRADFRKLVLELEGA